MKVLYQNHCYNRSQFQQLFYVIFYIQNYTSQMYQDHLIDGPNKYRIAGTKLWLKYSVFFVLHIAIVRMWIRYWTMATWLSLINSLHFLPLIFTFDQIWYHDKMVCASNGVYLLFEWIWNISILLTNLSIYFQIHN